MGTTGEKLDESQVGTESGDSCDRSSEPDLGVAHTPWKESYESFASLHRPSSCSYSKGSILKTHKRTEPGNLCQPSTQLLKHKGPHTHSPQSC